MSHLAKLKCPIGNGLEIGAEDELAGNRKVIAVDETEDLFHISSQCVDYVSDHAEAAHSTSAKLIPHIDAAFSFDWDRCRLRWRSLSGSAFSIRQETHERLF
jgi:hypothetical protein